MSCFQVKDLGALLAHDGERTEQASGCCFPDISFCPVHSSRATRGGCPCREKAYEVSCAPRLRPLSGCLAPRRRRPSMVAILILLRIISPAISSSMLAIAATRKIAKLTSLVCSSTHPRPSVLVGSP